MVPTLNQAIDGNDCATITHFIEKGVDPYIDIYGYPLLFRLISLEHKDCLEAVLKLGVDLNKVYAGKYNPADTAWTYANRKEWRKFAVPLLEQYGATDKDAQRIAEYNRYYSRFVAREYDELAVEIKQKLQAKDLQNWEVDAYKNLLEHIENYKEIMSNPRDPRRWKGLRK